MKEELRFKVHMCNHNIPLAVLCRHCFDDLKKEKSDLQNRLEIMTERKEEEVAVLEEKNKTLENILDFIDADGDGRTLYDETKEE